MSYSSTGVYTPATGATTAASGQTIQSAVWNAIFNDLTTALTQVMSQLLGTQSVMNNILFGNGGLEVWQRGSGSTSSFSVLATLVSTTLYTADRWYITTGANQASTVAAVTGLTNQSTLAAQVQRNNGATGTTAMTFGYPLDTDSLNAMHNLKILVSFVAKAGANWSPTSGTLSFGLYVGTGAVAKRGGGFTNEVAVTTGSVNLTQGGSATTTTVIGTVIVPQTTAQGEFQFTWTPTGTAGANDWFQIDDVQVIAMNSASTWLLPTSMDRVPFSVMLNDCKQHFIKTFAYTIAPVQNGGGNSALLTVVQQVAARTVIMWRFPVSMRVAPAITTYSPTSTSANFADVTSAATLVTTLTSLNTEGIGFLVATATTVGDLIAGHAIADSGI